MILCPSRGERIHFGLRLAQTGFTFQASDHRQTALVARLPVRPAAPVIRRAKAQRHPNVRATGKRKERRPLRSARKVKIRWKDADHRAPLAIDRNGLPQQRGIAAEPALPPSARSAVRGLNAAIFAKLPLCSRHSPTSALAGGIEGWPDLRPGLSAQMTASRSASGNGNVRSNAALIRLKMAVQAPIPSASVSTATAVKPGFFSSWRKANLRSFMVHCQKSVVSCPLSIRLSDFDLEASFGFRVSSFGFHSHLNAFIGSTRVARLAGNQLAKTATNTNNAETTRNVSGSLGVTPKSRLERRRVTANAPAIPKAAPVEASFTPWRMTSNSTWRRGAPNATRTPISRVRCTTANDSTP